MVTIEEIDNLQGRELDVAVDKYIFGREVAFEKGHAIGWNAVTGKPINWYPNDYVRLDYEAARDGVNLFSSDPSPRLVPRHSGDIAAAWLVKRRMAELNKVRDWHDAFIKSTPFEWYLLNKEAFCLHVCRAALRVYFADPLLVRHVLLLNNGG